VQTDEQIDEFIRQRVETAYHPSCTCKMGRDDDPLAVVDSQARVRGMESLRVVDSSIMPSITNGNLNAPTIMIAEKAADHILGKPLLPPSSASHYAAPHWETSQR
jgi:choline dehydrogenase